MEKELTWENVTLDDYIPVYGATNLLEGMIRNMDINNVTEDFKKLLDVVACQAIIESRTRGTVTAMVDPEEITAEFDQMVRDHADDKDELIDTLMVLLCEDIDNHIKDDMRKHIMNQVVTERSDDGKMIKVAFGGIEPPDQTQV